MSFAARWMQQYIIIVSQSKRKRQIPYDIICIWNLKYDTKELTFFKKQKQNHEHREQTGDCQGGGGWERYRVGGQDQQMQTIIKRMDKL